MKIRALFAIGLLFTGFTSTSFAVTPDSEAVGRAAFDIVRAYKAQGGAGVEALVRDCYAKGSANLYCIYLDVGAYSANRMFAANVKSPVAPVPFFMGAAYGPRIAAAMKQAGIAMQDETVFLRAVMAVMQPMLMKRAYQELK